MRRRGVMLILSSPSGAGKTTLSRRLLACEPQVSLSISATTRPPRPEEKEGVDYFFLSGKNFQRQAAAGDFLETAQIFGHFYGTPAKPVEEALSQGRDVLFDIDWQGVQQLMAGSDPITKVFILPPSAQELSDRLCKRAQDSQEAVMRRLRNAANEVSHYAEYDYILVNHDVEESLGYIRAILRAERMRRDKQPQLPSFVEKLGEDLGQLSR